MQTYAYSQSDQTALLPEQTGVSVAEEALGQASCATHRHAGHCIVLQGAMDLQLITLNNTAQATK
jgi:hypothetical protein